MNLTDRINILVKLGEALQHPDEKLTQLIKESYRYNNWFTKKNYEQAIQKIATQMLTRTALEAWIANYQLPDRRIPETIGLVMAGNIPLVGFHDVVCTFVAGHRAQIKLSEKDKLVLPYLLGRMAATDSRVTEYFELTERLAGFDRVIATGSDNTARYFNAYFGKYPHIIRKNRNAVAILTGKEKTEELYELGKDIFTYFGLGCRNVSKLFVPMDYPFKPLLEQLHEYREIIEHPKFKNNFDYNFTLLILNKIKYHSNGCLLIWENELLQSRIASLHFEYYKNEADLRQKLEKDHDQIQCVVSSQPVFEYQHISFGKAQAPGLADYADGVDTLAFLA